MKKLHIRQGTVRLYKARAMTAITLFLSAMVLLAAGNEAMAKSFDTRWFIVCPGDSSYECKVNSPIIGGDPELVANRACQLDVHSDSAPRQGIIGTYGERYDFYCLNGGWINTAGKQYSCDGSYWNSVAATDDDLEEQCAEKKKDKGPPCGDCCDRESNCVGNPVSVGTGNKYEQAADLWSVGQYPIRINRSYNSTAAETGALGLGWTINWNRSVVLFTDSSSVVRASVSRGNGRVLLFSLKNNGANAPLNPYDPNARWVPDADVSDELTRLVDGTGNTTGWTYRVSASDEFESYDQAGRLTAVANRTGQTQAVTYDGQGRLGSITDTFGRAVSFSFDLNGRISSLTDAASAVYQYTYDDQGRLSQVTYPGPASRNYVYNEAAFVPAGTIAAALTGVVDELGKRYATFSYDSSGRALSTEHAEGAQKYVLSYGASATTVTDPFGVQRTYGITTILGVAHSTGMSAPCNHCPGATSRAVAFDTHGNVTSKIDFNGYTTCYAYDSARNLENVRVEGALSSETCSNVLAAVPNRPDVRKISTQWHAIWRLPVKRAEPSRMTTFVYNGDVVNGSATYCAPASATVNGNPIGVLCSKSIQETTDPSGQQGLGATVSGAARTWSYTYNQFGQVLTATDPNGKTTTTAYYAADDEDLGKRGNVSTITNALGHVTNVTSYDAVGRPLSVTDPNGVVTTMTYHPRGWLTSKTVGGETTAYEYDAAGQLKKVTLPDSSFIQYTYDDAHRLKQIQDGMGNKLVYTLDAMGNRVKEEAFDPNNQLAKVKQQVFDSLNRLHQSVGAQ